MKVLVPLDGSTLAESALPLAAALMRAPGDTIHLVQAVSTQLTDETGFAFQAILEGAESYLAEVAERLRTTHGVEVRTTFALGWPAGLILEEVERSAISHVVMTTHGRSGVLRLVLGSVAEEVLRRSPVPLFLVPAAAAPAVPPFTRILVPLDGSDLSHAVVGPVTELAKRYGAELLVFHAAPGPYQFVNRSGRVANAVAEAAGQFKLDAEQYLASVQSELAADGIHATTIYRLGEPADEIVEVAESQAVDMIALTTHGRSGLDRLQHGSVAESVLRRSRVPLLVIGREAIRRQHAAAVAASEST